MLKSQVPVRSRLEEEIDGGGWLAGLCAVSGWRESMEDAEVLEVLPDGAALCGVFDGHGGSACSAYAAEQVRLRTAESGEAPKTAAELRRLFLSIDESFAATGRPGGSTATLVVARHGVGLLVANAGDTRALVGRQGDGSLVVGSGTEGGITIDHKPDLKSERDRIEAANGSVVFMGVPRVTSPAARVALATSRAFGDFEHKNQRQLGPEAQPVTADPEVFACPPLGPGEFVLIGCDGVFESNFTSAAVAFLAARVLRQTGSPRAAAVAVCEAAIDRGSQDNVSCCILLPAGRPYPTALYTQSGRSVTAATRGYPQELYSPGSVRRRKGFHPGHLASGIRDRGFLAAWQRMAKLAGYTPGQAMAELHRNNSEKLRAAVRRAAGDITDSLGLRVRTLFERYDEDGDGHWSLAELNRCASESGGKEVRPEQWLRICARSAADPSRGLSLATIVSHYRRGQGSIDLELRISDLSRQLAELAVSGGSTVSPPATPSGDRMSVDEGEEDPVPPEVSPALEARRLESERQRLIGELTSVLQWTAGEAAGYQSDEEVSATERDLMSQDLIVLQAEGMPPAPGQAGSQKDVVSHFDRLFTALQTSAEAAGPRPRADRPKLYVRTKPLAVLKQLVQAHPSLSWDERMVHCCSEVGCLVGTDLSDLTARVVFPLAGFAVWLPLPSIYTVNNSKPQAQRRARVIVDNDELRQAIEGHPSLVWDDDHSRLACGQMGTLLTVDEGDGTAQVAFQSLLLRAWLPLSVLKIEDESQESRTWGTRTGGREEAPERAEDGGAPPAKRRRPEADDDVLVET
eukprot:Hpha_TRINITY_DN15455_c0_g2::TRINITY_DN15455_c0_g2_i4::g.177087::m.177087